MSRKKFRDKTYSMTELIKAADYNLARVEQWSTYPQNLSWATNRHQYLIQAECILELLEVKLCGSIGGYDEGQSDSDHLHGIQSRLDWIKKKLKENK